MTAAGIYKRTPHREITKIITHGGNPTKIAAVHTRKHSQQDSHPATTGISFIGLAGWHGVLKKAHTERLHTGTKTPLAASTTRGQKCPPPAGDFR